MKILHVIAQMPSRTGSGVYYSNVIKELKKYGYSQAALFACQDGSRFDMLDNNLYPVCFKSSQVPFPIAGMSDVMPYESTIYSAMDDEMIRQWRNAFTVYLKKAKAEFNPDIVILHHLWILTSLAAEIFDNKIKIAICHNTDIRQAEQNPTMKNKYVTNLKSINAVLSLSDTQKPKISDVFGIERSSIMTVGGGFNQHIFYPAKIQNDNKTIRIVFSAKIEQSKGVFELVKAFKNLSLQKKNIHLDIIGAPNEENGRILDSLIGDAKNITIVPIKCQNELAEYIRKHHIFVMPSYFEGLGLMAIECLASGLRVVATEIDALISLLGDRVNKSGVIEYVKLPRIYDTDKPFEEDIDMFVQNLSNKILLQINRIENNEEIPEEIIFEINKHSWAGVAERINDEIMRLLVT